MNMKSKVWTVIFLVLFFPVGLFLMWKNQHFPKAVRIIITVLIGLVAIGTMVSEPDTQTASTTVKEEAGDKKEETPKEDKKVAEKKEEKATEATTEKKEEPKEEKVKTPEEEMVAVIEKAVGKKSNIDKRKRIMELEVNDHMGTDIADDKIIIAKLLGDENLTNKLTRTSMWMDSADLVESAFKKKYVSELVIMWHLPLVDQYGNEEDGNVMKITITRATADKINWENFTHDNLPNIADDYFEHPAFTK